MTKPFDMELFLSSVLSGSHVTRKRHIRQAQAIQKSIQLRWGCDNPWTWQAKHMQWFLHMHLTEHSLATKYYYLLTAKIICKRLGKGKNHGKSIISLKET